MDFPHLIREYRLTDIVTVDSVHYAITDVTTAVPGCTVIAPTQYPRFVRRLLEHGYSQRYSKPYAQVTGVVPWVLFTYSLHHLPATQKQVFSHVLAGTGGRKGLLTAWHGQKIGKSAFLVPQTAEQTVIAVFNHWGILYTAEVIFRGD
jgi:hypothetical protein